MEAAVPADHECADRGVQQHLDPHQDHRQAVHAAQNKHVDHRIEQHARYVGPCQLRHPQRDEEQEVQNVDARRHDGDLAHGRPEGCPRQAHRPERSGGCRGCRVLA